jgi:hypothetical protein
VFLGDGCSWPGLSNAPRIHVPVDPDASWPVRVVVCVGWLVCVVGVVVIGGLGCGCVLSVA